MNLRREVRPMAALAAPLALAEIGWMTMGVVDTVMAGPLGAGAVGAGSLGNMLFYPVAAWGTGVLMGMDTLVAQSFGAEDARDCRITLVNGIWLSCAAAPLLALAIWMLVPLLRVVGTNPNVQVLLDPYLKALLPGLLPLLLFTALRRYGQAVDIVRPVTFALVSANVVNFVGDWVLMYGHWGAPAMGLAGSGWSTSISRTYMMAVLAIAVYRQGRLGVSWRPDFARLRRLVRLGLPAAAQFALEGAVFGVVSVFAARLDEASLAAHGIAVQVIATTYMVPLGISSAAAVRVGQAVGRKDEAGAATAGWAAILISAVFMSAAGLVLWIVPRAIIELFIRDPVVADTGATLLRIAAFFELFDGVQVTATGALRGLGNTHSPAVAHFTGYWLVGLPLSYILCTRFGFRAAGIWIGLLAALILIGARLVFVWATAVRRGQRHSAPDIAA